MSIREEIQFEPTLKGKITGASVSLVVHVILFAALAIYMVPKYIEENKDEQEITLEQFEDVTLDEEIDIDELIEEEQEEFVENEFETPVLETPEVDLSAPIEFDDVPDMIPVESDLAIANNLDVKINSVNQDFKNVMIKKYGSRAAENGLLGTYFSRFDFSGPARTRIDKTLNKTKSAESPWPGKIPGSCYSVIWTGRLVPKEGGIYTIYLSSDDGARFWINGNVVVEQWYVHPTRVDRVQIKMIAGESYDIKYAFNQQHGPSESRLEWSCEGAGIERQLIPEDCMWSDGIYSMEVINWLKKRPKEIAKHCLKNPVLLDGTPMSHIAANMQKQIDERHLRTVKLDDVIPIWQKLKAKGMLEKPKLIKEPTAREIRTVELQNQVFGDEEDLFDELED